MAKNSALPEYNIPRVYLPKQTLGSWFDEDGKTVLAKTMELPWRNNARSTDPYKASCLPEGRYLCVWSPPVLKDNPSTPIDESGGRRYRPYEHFIILGTDPRQGCLVHPSKNVEGLLGCISVGSSHVNLDGDLDYELPGGPEAMAFLVKHCPKKFYINITSKNGVPYKLSV